MFEGFKAKGNCDECNKRLRCKRFCKWNRKKYTEMIRQAYLNAGAKRLEELSKEEQGEQK